MKNRLFLAGPILLVLPVVGVEPVGSAPAPPNIVLILLDDARVNGTMDQPDTLPLTKRWLAAGGTTFSEGYATTPMCCPERATIWSGRLSHNHKVYDNHAGDNLDRDWIIPRYLGDAGYRTALVGKVITDWEFRYEPPHFDDYAAFQGGYDGNHFMVKDPGEDAHHTEEAPYTTDFIAEKAVAYVNAYEADDARPFYLQVAPHPPHNIREAQKDDCSLESLYSWPARHDAVPIPAWKPTPAVTVEGNNPAEKQDKAPEVRRAGFAAECGEATYRGHFKTLLAADEMVDAIMKALEANGELANTLVVFTSDNGFSWAERGLTSKGYPYTEHVRVPFLARWGAVFKAGASDARPVGGEDLLPTFLAAAGYTPPEVHHPLDGRSFLPGAEGRKLKYLEFGPVGITTPAGYDGHRGIPTWASLRSPTWQYIEYYGDDNRTVAFREYYDLVGDPWELDNLLADTDASNDPDVAGLSARLQRAWTCAGTSGPSACP